jgi:hypothetical protein
MKKNKYISIGILIIVIGFIIAILLAILVVGSNVNTNASNDGWLGFLGGLFGSFLSGVVAIYILNVNRKDAEKVHQENFDKVEKIQEENHKDTERALQQNANMFNYRLAKEMVNNVYELIAELINIAEYNNLNKKSTIDKIQKEDRAKEICFLLELKLGNENYFDNLLKEIKVFNEIFIQHGKINGYSKSTMQMKEKQILSLAQVCCKGYLFHIFLL